jgi:ATP-binding cassette subfamily B protein
MNSSCWPERTRVLRAGIVTLSVLDAVLSVLAPLGAGLIVDAVLTGRSRTTVLVFAVLGVAPLVAKAGLAVVSRRAGTALGERLAVDVRTEAFARLQGARLSFFQQPAAGRFVARVMQDSEILRQFWTRSFATIVANGLEVLIGLATVGVLSWPVAVGAVLTLPLYVIPVRMLSRRSIATTRGLSEARNRTAVYLTEKFNPTSVAVTKSFGREGAEEVLFRGHVEEMQRLGVRALRATEAITLLLTLSPLVVQALVYGVGGWLALDGVIAPAALVSVAMLLTQLYAKIATLIAAPAELGALRAAEESLAELATLPAESVSRGTGVLPPGGLDVRFDHVSASHVLREYQPDTRRTTETATVVIKDLSLHVPAGRTAAIVGPSGAGKSTIAGLLLRLYEADEGRVLLGGVDAASLTREQLARDVCLVPQEASLFDGTLADNLRYGRPDAGDADLWQALEAVGLDRLVRGWEAGLATPVGIAGQRLSGGERQRVAIARAMLVDPRVIVLDEATAHLDQRSEALVQQALDRLVEHRTAIVIAHRLTTVRDADVIFVVDGGRVDDSGTHEELMARGGLYAEMHASSRRR